VKDLLLAADHERRRLLTVKRAKRPEIPSRLLDGYITGDHLGDVGTRLNLINKALGDHLLNFFPRYALKPGKLVNLYFFRPDDLIQYPVNA